MVTSLRSKWAVGKAVRAGLAVEGASRTIFTLAGEAHINRGVKMVRDVTDEQRGRRPIFNATLRAAASWLFFRVAHLTRINPDMGASLAP
jgi:hypothetical protein